MRSHHRPRWWGPSIVAIAFTLTGGCGSGSGPHRTSDDGVVFGFTSPTDFAQGTLVNLHAESVTGGLVLNEEVSTFPFIWIALSNRGTICKIDTRTGEIKGEYRTAPETFNYPDPSRTTVGLDGSVWAGNRQAGSVVHVALLEANQAVDRNGNGVIDTSTGYGDVLPWPNTSGEDTDGGVATAVDECILHFVPVAAERTRHVSINVDGNIWVSGIYGSVGNHVFQLIDRTTGAILRTEGPFAGGGYGGLVDAQGVVWSASSGSPGVMRWDPSLPVGATNPIFVNIDNYGLAIDPNGFVWVSTLGGGTVRKLAPDGTLVGAYPQGTANAQGLACDGNGDVWISSSLSGGDTVSHLKNDGTLVGLVHGVGDGSTGVAIAADGKIWTANINDGSATRIDPDAGPVGADGVTPIGAVDLTVDLPEANPYNYSDMTGAVALNATSPQGIWQVVVDGLEAGRRWAEIRWNEEAEGVVPAGASITVEVRAADSIVGLAAQAFVEVGNGAPFTQVGRYLEVRVTLKPAPGGASPVLSDLAVQPE